MTTSFQVFFLVPFAVIIILIGNSSGANLVLENTAPTNWGYWGKWEVCPKGTFASGMQLKVEGRHYFRGDDTALNGIKLLCTSPLDQGGFETKLMSTEGPFGEWGQVFHCENGYLTGFQLQSEGVVSDNTAANNLRVFCSNPKSGYYQDGVIEGDGMAWGSWGKEEKCRKKQALCGLKTQVSWNLGSYQDNIGLNNVHMECCDVPFSLKSCTPKDSWELMVECDNIKSGTEPLLCKLEKKRGLGSATGFADFLNTMKDLGFSLAAEGEVLQEAFAVKLNSTTSKTGHDWANEASETWIEQKSTTSEFNVPAGKLQRVYQVVGICGPVSVYTAQFKKEESSDPFK